MLDLLVMSLALVCAPPMIYGMWAGRQRQRGVDVPAFGALIAAAWAFVRPAVVVVGYLCKRALAFQWTPTEDEKPPLFRATLTAAYVDDEAPTAPDEANRPQTDRVFALADAIDSKALDRTRAALIEALVSAGWAVGGIRGLIKGDTGAIGAEVEAAKQRLGINAPPRTLRISEYIAGKATTREVER